jgi:hypothetical protein
MATPKRKEHTGDLGRAIYLAASRAGTSLLEMAERMNVTAEALSEGRGIDIRVVANDCARTGRKPPKSSEPPHVVSLSQWWAGWIWQEAKTR